LDPNRLPKKMPIASELAGAGEAIRVDGRGPGAGLDSVESRVIAVSAVVSGGGWTLGRDRA
jgi:hypothetical protein